MQQARAQPETISVLTAAVEEAVALLRAGRYSELDAQFERVQQQAEELEALKLALRSGTAADPRLRQCCEQLGRSLFVFSEVAKQVAAIEAGLAQMAAGPRGGSYSRDGHCGNADGPHFHQEA